MPRNDVSCRCFSCKGAYVPRSTRDRHRERSRRDASKLIGSSSQSRGHPTSRALLHFPDSPAAECSTLSLDQHPTTLLDSPDNPFHLLSQDCLEPEAPAGHTFYGDRHHSCDTSPSARIAAAEQHARDCLEQGAPSVEHLDLIGEDSDWEDSPLEYDEPSAENTESEPPMPLETESIPDPITTTPSAWPLGSDLSVDEVDPFRQTHADLSATKPARGAHPQLPVFLLYVLVLWLHTQWHLPFRACNSILIVVSLIMHSFGLVVTPPILTTLPGIISALDAEPTFQTLPVCPSCMQVFPDTIDDHAVCQTCGSPLFITNPTPAEVRQGRTTRRVRKPRLRFPYKSLEEQLVSFLLVPGLEATCEQWRQRSRTPGTWHDIFDGQVMRDLQAPDGMPFFPSDTNSEGPCEHAKHEAPDELRLGVSLGVDWFSYLRSQIAPSHTSCPMSLNIVNLPPALRYRTSNLLLVGVMPGPKEAGPDQVQHFLRVLVNELLHLWKHGIVIKTPKCPNGRLVRVILVGVMCDKPAAHKLGGFGSHSHTFFCTCDWITKQLRTTLAAFVADAFKKRTNGEHRELMCRYKALSSDAARERFVKDHATRWSELARLPYFDMCRMVVVDPMHNLFLGLVKTHFYHIWVQGKVLRKTRELRTFHTLLANLQMPARLGRLPSLIGEPAGGSLTADQWLVLVTIVGPLVMPQIWHDYGVLDRSDAQQRRNDNLLQSRVTIIQQTLDARKQRNKKKKQSPKSSSGGSTRHKRPRAEMEVNSTNPRRSGRSRRPTQRALEMQLDSDDAGAGSDAEDAYSGCEDDSEVHLPCNMHPRDLSNFLKLSCALRLLLQDQLNESSLARADKLLREYCSELLELYGPAVIRPNHHYAVHTTEFIRDYGPLREFWTFLFERMNKVLKSYRTSNHAGGELECSFLREFLRTVNTSRLLAEAARSAVPGTVIAQAVEHMFKTSSDDRGTLQALANELDSVSEDAMLRLKLSPRASSAPLEMQLYFKLLHYLSRIHPQRRLHSILAVPSHSDSFRVPNHAIQHDYVIVNGKRYYASSRAPKSAESLVAIHWQAGSGGGAWLDHWVGELTNIFVVGDPWTAEHILGHVKWFQPSMLKQEETPWAECAALHVKLWSADVYSEGRDSPESLVDLQSVISGAVRTSIFVNQTRAWATILTDPPCEL